MNNKTKKVTVRFNEAEHEKIYTAALERGLSISEYMRYRLLHDNNKDTTHVTKESPSDRTDINRNDEAKHNLIQLNALIETLSDKNKNKTKMKDLVEKSWQSLF